MKQESKQKEATVEQSEVASEETTEATPEVTSTEAKETSERQRTEEEFRKLQSIMTKAINESKAKDSTIQSVQNELQELRNQMERQRLEAQKKELEDAKDEPELLRIIRRRHEVEERERKFKEDTERVQENMLNAWEDSKRLAKEYGVDFSELLDCKTSRERELLAYKLSKEQAKGAKTSQEPSGFRPDSNISDVGERRSWTQKEIEDMPVEEYRKHKNDIEKALREGRIK